jgi:hypothetical protein
MEQALSNGNVTLSLDKDTGYMFLILIDHHHYWAGHGKEQTEESLYVSKYSELPGAHYA